MSSEPARSGGSSLPAPPWRRPARRQAPPRRIVTPDLILDVALKLIDEESLDGLSMRRIADELGTGPATLYGHFANKDDLLEKALDRVLGEVDVPEPDPARWSDQVREVAWATYRALTGHNDLARASLGNVVTGPNTLRVHEGMLALMIAGGVPPGIAVGAKDRILLYVKADAYETSLYAAKLRTYGPEAVERFLGQVRDYLSSLPTDRFPYTARYAGESSGSCDDRFETGLTLLLDGLVALVARGTPDRPD